MENSSRIYLNVGDVLQLKRDLPSLIFEMLIPPILTGDFRDIDKKAINGIHLETIEDYGRVKAVIETIEKKGYRLAYKERKTE